MTLPIMINSSVLHNNLTQESFTNSKVTVYTMWIITALIIVGFCFFFYYVTVMLNVFFLTPELQQTARYVLFVCMLINDTSYLIVTFFMMFASLYLLYVPVPLCYILYTVSAMTFRVTPYNLAAMAVEQYVAICYPLRHAQLCTPQRAKAAFTIICLVLMIPYVAELCVMFSSFTNIFHLYIVCGLRSLIVNNFQNIIRSIDLILCFSSVGLVIIFTYVKIMLVALKASSQSSSASKAGKTVLVHTFQFLLCLGSLVNTLTQAFSLQAAAPIHVTNFFIFTYVPRFLSPLIYGIRDDVLRKHFKKIVLNLISTRERLDTGSNIKTWRVSAKRRC
ncbi:odorant receptor 131-2-like [Pseudophryne corroboree]|uniref:odorant receptor 131-2-like n=1 Tax=Pseudophryne corroboree TaxID=495146 RepID=UPI003081B197